MKMKFVAIFALVFVISGVMAQTPMKEAPKSVKRSKAIQHVPAKSGAARLPARFTAGAITVPASVIAGNDFTITVKTGGNGCSSMGDTSVILGEGSADVFVYDMTTATRPDIMCTMIYKEFDHEATLRFSKKGEAVIRFWTRDHGDANSPMGKPSIVEKRIIVK